MSNKNVRNTSSMSVINFTSEPGATGATGATGSQGSPGAMSYSYQTSIPIVYDPDGYLFNNPINSTISCEKMGNKIFIKINGFVEFPVNQANIYSNAAVPVAYRPLTDQYAICVVFNGYVNPTLILQNIDVYSSYFGVCKLGANGILTVSPDRDQIGPINTDLVTQASFQGPNNCGIMSQVLVFDAN